MFTKSSSASAVRKIVFIRVRRSILAAAIVPAGAMLALLPGSSALADAIFTPTDQILGGKENINTNKFEVGVVGTAAGVNNWPAGESPNHLIDGVV